MPVDSTPTHCTPVHYRPSSDAPKYGGEQNLTRWKQIPAATREVALGILNDVRDGNHRVTDRFITFHGCQYRVHFTPKGEESFWQRLVRRLSDLDAFYPGFPGTLSVTRIGLPANPLMRLGVAVKELFTHRVSDILNLSKDAAIGYVDRFESRAEALHRAIEGEMLATYRLFTGPAVVADITDYTNTANTANTDLRAHGRSSFTVP